MKVFDLEQFEPDSEIETDLCIVGSGPAGTTIAHELAGSGVRVVLLESGGLAIEPETQALYEILNTGAPRHMNQDVMRTRILGGSSHIWTGRCAPFDALDYEQRAWIPNSGWPIRQAEIQPYIERAAPYLGLAAHAYDETLWRSFAVSPPKPALYSRDLRPMFWQFSRRPVGPGSAHFGHQLVDAEAPNVEILLHANLTHINLSDDGTRFTSVEVASLGGKRARVRAKAMVLACGGVENARLLLASNKVFAAGVGNGNDMVGRFLMDHTSGSVGHFHPEESLGVRARFGHYWVDNDQGRHVYLHGVGLSREIQEREGLLNCHAYMEEFGGAKDDPWSAIERLKESVRSGLIPLADARQVLGGAVEIARGLYRRQFKRRPQQRRSSGLSCT